MSAAVSTIDFGSCWSCVTDVTMPATLASGNQAVAESTARRWQTPRGGLIDDPSYGEDLTRFLNDDLAPSDLARIGTKAAAEALKDERVSAASVVATLVGGVLMVAGTLTTATGPFTMVAAISSVTVTLLQVSP